MLVEVLRALSNKLLDWRHNNFAKLGTAEYRQNTLAHMFVTELIALDGGTAEQRAFVMRAMLEPPNMSEVIF